MNRVYGISVEMLLYPFIVYVLCCESICFDSYSFNSLSILLRFALSLNFHQCVHIYTCIYIYIAQRVLTMRECVSHFWLLLIRICATDYSTIVLVPFHQHHSIIPKNHSHHINRHTTERRKKERKTTIQQQQKKNIMYRALLLFVFLLFACNGWLEKENRVCFSQKDDFHIITHIAYLRSHIKQRVRYISIILVLSYGILLVSLAFIFLHEKKSILFVFCFYFWHIFFHLS